MTRCSGRRRSSLGGVWVLLIVAATVLASCARAVEIEVRAGVSGSSKSDLDDEELTLWEAATECFGESSTTTWTTFSATSSRFTFSNLELDITNLEDADYDRLCRCVRSEASYADVTVTDVSIYAKNKKVHDWSAPTSPNIVLALADDLGWADVGWHEYKESGLDSATPFLDTLVSDSVRVERMYTAPVCSPSRAQLWTGRFFYRTGHGPAVTTGGFYGLSGRETTLAEILKGNGYHTALIGKWHLGYQDERLWPTFRGFDNHIGPFSIDYESRLKTKSLEGTNPAFDLTQSQVADMISLHNASIKLEKTSFAGELPPVYDTDDSNGEYETMHGTDIIKYEAERYVHVYYASEVRAKPLFLNVAFRAPHTPLTAPARYGSDSTLSKLFKKAGSNERLEYLRMVHALDVAIEHVVTALEEEYAWHDTVFIFTSDNGGLSTDAGGASNYPLNGQKNNVWEGGTRVATLVHGTTSDLAALDASVRGTANEQFFHFVDLLPTIATGIAGIAEKKFANAWKCDACLAHNDNVIDGENRWEAISTGTVDVEPVLHAVSVVTEEQADLMEDLDLLKTFVPRKVWDPTQYDGTGLASYVDGNSASSNWWSNFQEQIVRHGGGAVMYGPYKLAIGYSNPGKSNFPWEMVTSNYYTKYTKTKNNNPVAIDFDLDGDFPRGHENLYFLFNLEDDPSETKNLLVKKYRTEEIEILVRKMISFYIKTQSAEESVTDNYLRMGHTFDPAELLVGLEYGIHFRPFCDKSERCFYDLDVTSSSLKTSFKLTPAPTSTPTEAPVVTPTKKPTPQPTPLATTAESTLSNSDKNAADKLRSLPNWGPFPNSCSAYLYYDTTLSSAADVALIKSKVIKTKLRKWVRKCWRFCSNEGADCNAFRAEQVSSQRIRCSLYSARSSILKTKKTDSNANVAVLSDACFSS
ncbi:Arylsulfatase B [Hondaea fermentalgiana]|uniref:Arylsulfatase B n=1 Tax=Hondaea fermentalgiana TaxID=2315210 RepID=A0A2R5GWL2_9STRA|nr:Arylsulfatase B [Hondaea fermentalgiana]|eukprot:GBG34158.1 Arylsulfatase B [Hondaea fermentalgiana]